MRAHRLALASLFAAILGALVVLFVPLYRGATANAIDVYGSWIFVVVAKPLVLASVPTLLRRPGVRKVSAALLWVNCLFSFASVGLYFIPAAILMTIAALQRDPMPVN